MVGPYTALLMKTCSIGWLHVHKSSSADWNLNFEYLQSSYVTEALIVMSVASLSMEKTTVFRKENPYRSLTLTILCKRFRSGRENSMKLKVTIITNEGNAINYFFIVYTVYPPKFEYGVFFHHFVLKACGALLYNANYFEALFFKSVEQSCLMEICHDCGVLLFFAP